MKDPMEVLTNVAKSMRDQAWAHARDHEADIARIALHGPDGSDRDTKIVRAVFCTVMGELNLRSADVVS